MGGRRKSKISRWWRLNESHDNESNDAERYGQFSKNDRQGYRAVEHSSQRGKNWPAVEEELIGILMRDGTRRNEGILRIYDNLDVELSCPLSYKSPLLAVGSHLCLQTWAWYLYPPTKARSSASHPSNYLS